MIKNTVIALVAVATLASAAAPAFANESVFGNDSSVEMKDFMKDSIESQLRQNGVNVTDVEDWSGLIRAYVTLEDGTQTMQFFEPGSLEQVTL